MKNAILMILATLVLVSTSESAGAGGSLTLEGRWAGLAAAAPFDLDGDGIDARTFDMKTYGSIAFAALQGAVDASFVDAPGACADPAAIELRSVGTFLFRGHLGDALYAEVDSNHHLCFNPANPNEVLKFRITGGTGIYSGRTGNGTAVIRDTVLITGANGAPLVIDSRGEFSVTLR